MKTRQEQIEAMAKERNEIKDIMKLLDKYVSLNPMCKAEVATVVYGNNYRKLPEGAVVLTKEELVKTMESGYIYDSTRGNKINIIEMAREIERKETVKEFAEKLKNG